MRKLALVALGIALSLAPLAAQTKVTIAAAANLGSVAAPLAAAFEKAYPSYRAEFTFGASGALVTQILHGAPFQLFLSADTDFPQKLVDAGQTEGPVRVYALGSLILLTTKRLDLSKGLAVLTEPEVVQIANSNPETAPYGRAAQEALEKAGLYERLRSKLVMAQSVGQALQFTLSGTDAGFVNRSALFSKELSAYDQEGRFWIAVDPGLYRPISQGFVLLKDAASVPAARAFAAFLLSPEARAVFAAAGYGTP